MSNDTSTTTATDAPALPPLERQVTGQQYGGQYTSDHEYELRLELITPAEGALASVQLLDTSGFERYRQNLTREEAVTFVRAVGAGTTEPVGVQDLSRDLTWSLSGERDFVVVRDSELDEIAAWLGYALGQDVWDGGDEWEY